MSAKSRASFVRGALLSAAVFAVGLLAVVAQASWGKKGWRNWSREDCSRILGDSPWGQTSHAGGGGTINQYGDFTVGSAYSYLYFGTALPVRLALARLSQLDKHYNKLSPQQKQAFDQQTNESLAGGYDDRFLVHVHYTAVLVPRRPIEIDPPESAELVLADGRRILPMSVHWVRRELRERDALLEFDLVFPRVVEGRPVISATTPKVLIQYGTNYGRWVFTFKPQEMMYEGKLEY